MLFYMRGWATILTNNVQEREIPTLIRIVPSDHTHIVESVTAASIPYGLYVHGQKNQMGHLPCEIRRTKNL